MKTLVFATLLTTFSALSCSEGTGSADDSATDSPRLEADKKAILDVIKKESNAFFTRDYATWKSTYAQTDYAFQAWSNNDGTFDSNVGWHDIDQQIGKYISDNPDVSHPKIERKNMMFKFYGKNAAYLTWDQFNSDAKERFFHHSKEVRVMEKINGEWKIVCVSAFWDYKNLIPADRLPLIRKIANESRGKNKI